VAYFGSQTQIKSTNTCFNGRWYRAGAVEDTVFGMSFFQTAFCTIIYASRCLTCKKDNGTFSKLANMRARTHAYISVTKNTVIPQCLFETKCKFCRNRTGIKRKV